MEHGQIEGVFWWPEVFFLISTWQGVNTREWCELLKSNLKKD